MLSLVHPRRFSRKRTAWVFLCLPRGARTLAATKRRGYRKMENYGHTDMMAEIRQMMETADPQGREQLKMQLRQMTEQM